MASQEPLERCLTSCSRRAKPYQKVKARGLPEPVESVLGIVLKLESVSLNRIDFDSTRTLLFESIWVEIQYTAPFEVVDEISQSIFFCKLFGGTSHLLCGPFVEGVPKLEVRLLRS